MDPQLVAMQQRAARPLETMQKAPELDHWLTIFNKQYEMVKKLGSGGEADTYRYICRNGSYSGVPLDCAIKASKPESNQKPTRQEAYSWQIRIHPQLLHKYVCRCFTFFTHGAFNLIVMEYCNRGSLKDLFLSKGAIDEMSARTFAYQTLCGLDYIHKSGFIHRDIKLDNIFLKETAEGTTCKIGDFGLAIPINIDPASIRFAGTPQYIAPELIAMQYASSTSQDTANLRSLISHYHKNPITEKIDIWAFGVTFFQLLFGSKPFSDKDSSHSSPHIRTYESIMRGAYHIPQRTSVYAIDLIRKCLCPDAKQRPSCEDLLKHSWFSYHLQQPAAPQSTVSQHGRALSLQQTLPSSTINYYGPLVLNHEFASYYGNFILLSNALFFAKFNDDSCGVTDVITGHTRIYKSSHSSCCRDYECLDNIPKTKDEDYFFTKRALLLQKYYQSCRKYAHFSVKEAGAFSNNISVINNIEVPHELAPCSMVRYDSMIILCLSGNRSMIYDPINGVVHYYVSHQQSRTYRMKEVLSRPDDFNCIYIYAKTIRDYKI